MLVEFRPISQPRCPFSGDFPKQSTPQSVGPATRHSQCNAPRTRREPQRWLSKLVHWRVATYREADPHRQRLGRGFRGRTRRRWDDSLPLSCGGDTPWQQVALDKASWSQRQEEYLCRMLRTRGHHLDVSCWRRRHNTLPLRFLLCVLAHKHHRSLKLSCHDIWHTYCRVRSPACVAWLVWHGLCRRLAATQRVCHHESVSEDASDASLCGPRRRWSSARHWRHRRLDRRRASGQAKYCRVRANSQQACSPKCCILTRMCVSAPNPALELIPGVASRSGRVSDRDLRSHFQPVEAGPILMRSNDPTPVSKFGQHYLKFGRS